jgi:hypothetical protein
MRGDPVPLAALAAELLRGSAEPDRLPTLLRCFDGAMPIDGVALARTGAAARWT